MGVILFSIKNNFVKYSVMYIIMFFRVFIYSESNNNSYKFSIIKKVFKKNNIKIVKRGFFLFMFSVNLYALPEKGFNNGIL